MLQRLLEVLIPLLVAVDPLGMIPVYVAMTARLSPKRRREVSMEAISTGLIVCVGFMFLGHWLFRLLMISDTDFRIAGGIILLVLAVLDILIVGKPAVHEEEMDGIVPLGMPLIAGPAALTTVLVLAGNPVLGYAWTLTGIALTFAILTITLLLSDWVVRVIGMNALKAFSKLVMVLLAAIAVNFIRTGILQVVEQSQGGH
jgi:multiple antibiotic resistance protein